MVNVHEKYPDGAVNKAAYLTDGSNVRDATEEEKVRYRDTNKHRRKKVDEKSSSSEPSVSNTVLVAGEPTPARPASARAEQSTGNASSGDKSGGNCVKDVECDRSRNRGELEKSQKSNDRGGARAQEGRESALNRAATTSGGELDEEEADRRKMAEIQGRIKARKAAKDLEIARAMIEELKPFARGAPVAPPKRSRRATQRSKGEGERETGITRETKKTLATPVTRGLVDY